MCQRVKFTVYCLYVGKVSLYIIISLPLNQMLVRQPALFHCIFITLNTDFINDYMHTFFFAVQVTG